MAKSKFMESPFGTIRRWSLESRVERGFRVACATKKCHSRSPYRNDPKAAEKTARHLGWTEEEFARWQRTINVADRMRVEAEKQRGEAEHANDAERALWSRLYAALTGGRAGTTYSLEDLERVVTAYMGKIERMQRGADSLRDALESEHRRALTAESRAEELTEALKRMRPTGCSWAWCRVGGRPQCEACDEREMIDRAIGGESGKGAGNG